jgi:hypothetical protein
MVMSDSVPLPFPASVKRYWRNLIPLAALAPAFLPIPVYNLIDWSGWKLVLLIVVMAVWFYAAFIVAMWPMYKRRVTFSFWIAVMAAYLGSGLLTTVVIVAVRC